MKEKSQLEFTVLLQENNDEEDEDEEEDWNSRGGEEMSRSLCTL